MITEFVSGLFVLLDPISGDRLRSVLITGAHYSAGEDHDAWSKMRRRRSCL
jgi:hypothetical protein